MISLYYFSINKSSSILYVLSKSLSDSRRYFSYKNYAEYLKKFQIRERNPRKR